MRKILPIFVLAVAASGVSAEEYVPGEFLGTTRIECIDFCDGHEEWNPAFYYGDGLLRTIHVYKRDDLDIDYSCIADNRIGIELLQWDSAPQEANSETEDDDPLRYCAMIATLNDNGFIKTIETEFLRFRYDLEYNEDLQLSRISYIDDSYDQRIERCWDISYRDGSMESWTLSVTEGENKTTEVCGVVSSEIENVSKLCNFSFDYGIGIYYIDMLYYAGLLGYPSRYLPAGLKYTVAESTVDDAYEWTLNDNGFPVERRRNGSDVTAYIWTDVETGITQTPSSDSAVETIYGIDGLPRAYGKGLNIIRHADGTVTKKMVR